MTDAKSDPALNPQPIKRRLVSSLPFEEDTDDEDEMRSRLQTGGGAVIPYREVTITPVMDISGKVFIFLGDFAKFSQKKVRHWLERRGGRITKKVHRKVAAAICGENVPQEVSDRLQRLQIECWDEDDTLNFIAMYYLKSDFLPATYRITDVTNIEDVAGHKFKLGDEVTLNGKRRKGGSAFAHVISPVNCYLPEESVERVFDVWSLNAPAQFYQSFDFDGEPQDLKSRTVISNMNHNGKVHIWYPRQGWMNADTTKMTRVRKMTAAEYIGTKLKSVQVKKNPMESI